MKPSSEITLLIPIGKELLLATFGYSVVQSLRRVKTLESAFESLVIGYFSILLFQQGLDMLWNLGDLLAKFLEKLGPRETVKEFILSSMSKASSTYSNGPDASLMERMKSLFGNSLSFSLQIFRTGVWGVITSIVEWFFMLVSLVIEAARTVLWEILITIFPIGCGLYPVFPRILRGLCQFAFEVTLAYPLLVLIEILTSRVARSYATKTDSLGLYILVVEIVAIVLMVSIPSVTHRFVTGALTGDLGAASAFTQNTKTIFRRVTSGGVR